MPPSPYFSCQKPCKYSPPGSASAWLSFRHGSWSWQHFHTEQIWTEQLRCHSHPIQQRSKPYSCFCCWQPSKHTLCVSRQNNLYGPVLCWWIFKVSAGKFILPFCIRDRLAISIMAPVLLPEHGHYWHLIIRTGMFVCLLFSFSS